jgi:hypothetical protein
MPISFLGGLQMTDRILKWNIVRSQKYWPEKALSRWQPHPEQKQWLGVIGCRRNAQRNITLGLSTFAEKLRRAS